MIHVHPLPLEHLLAVVEVAVAAHGDVVVARVAEERAALVVAVMRTAEAPASSASR